MTIAFAGLRHAHIYVLADIVRADPSVTVSGFWEENDEAAGEARRFFTEHEYASYDELLADPKVETVAIGDYYGIRGQRIIQALKAGKHVLTDKPVCTSLEELDEIEKLCRKTGLKLGCMLDLRYDPALRLAGELIREGKLGEIRSISFTGQHPLLWGSRPMWYFEEGKHGGTLNDIAIHGLDALEMVTGIPYAETLFVRQWNQYAVHAPDFADSAQFVGKLANGASVMADVSYSAPPAAFRLPSYWRFTFWGENGYLECRLGEGSVTIACAEDASARVLQAPVVSANCLSDLMDDISKLAPRFDTNSVLQSSRIALELQQAADQKGKE